jgi:hypothetical protein
MKTETFDKSRISRGISFREFFECHVGISSLKRLWQPRVNNTSGQAEILNLKVAGKKGEFISHPKTQT